MKLIAHAFSECQNAASTSRIVNPDEIGKRAIQISEQNKFLDTVKTGQQYYDAEENEGVDRIFAIPGKENPAVVEALRGSRIDLVLTRHEQAAAFMARRLARG
jgi:hypothetical protein